MKRAVLFVLLAAMADGPALLAQQGGAATRTASIRGRVVAGHTGEAVRGATVQATSSNVTSETATTLRVTTDAQGRYEFPELPPGPYRISASRTGFVTQQFGQRGAFETVDPVSVRAGDRLLADFALSRGGAVTGRVFDDTGEPVAEARVQPMRLQVIRGQRRLLPVGNPRQTDDLGVYRVYGLPPGDYYIAASIDPETLTVTATGSTTLFVNGVISGTSAGSTIAYAPTYYPGTPRVADAYRINLTPGEEEYNVNVALVPSRLVRVSGTVADGSGAPVQARVELLAELEGLRANAHTVMSAPDGTFSMSGIPPGRYMVNVVGRILEDRPPDVAWLSIDVDTEDLSGVTIVTNNGSTAAGRVTTDGDAGVDTSGIRVLAERVGPASGRANTGAQVVGGSFEIDQLIGPYTLTADRLPPGWVVRSIMANGADVTDTVVEFRGGEYVDVQVSLTNRLAEVYGTVRADGRAVPRAAVIVFPEDASKWTAASRHVKTARTDQNGAFAVRALSPNQRYLIAAVEYVNDGDAQDTEFLQRLRGRATSFTVVPNENKTVDLTVVPR